MNAPLSFVVYSFEDVCMNFAANPKLTGLLYQFSLDGLFWVDAAILLEISNRCQKVLLLISIKLRESTDSSGE